MTQSSAERPRRPMQRSPDPAGPSPAPLSERVHQECVQGASRDREEEKPKRLLSYQLSCGSPRVARGVVASVVVVFIIFFFLDLLIASFHGLLLFCRVSRGHKHTMLLMSPDCGVNVVTVLNNQRPWLAGRRRLHCTSTRGWNQKLIKRLSDPKAWGCSSLQWPV